MERTELDAMALSYKWNVVAINSVVLTQQELRMTFFDQMDHL